MIVEKIMKNGVCTRWKIHTRKKEYMCIMTTQSFCRIVNCNDKIKSAFLNVSSENK